MRESHFEQDVDFLRIGLSFGRFHHLSDEEAEDAFFAALILFDLCRMFFNHVINQGLQLSFIGQLSKALGFYQPGGRLIAGVEFREQLLGDVQADGAVMHQLQ